LNMSVSGVRMTAMVGECVEGEDRRVRGEERTEERTRRDAGADRLERPASGNVASRSTCHRIMCLRSKRDGVPPKCSMLSMRS
jgi:hypothetical protein